MSTFSRLGPHARSSLWPHSATPHTGDPDPTREPFFMESSTAAVPDGTPSKSHRPQPRHQRSHTRRQLARTTRTPHDNGQTQRLWTIADETPARLNQATRAGPLDKRQQACSSLRSPWSPSPRLLQPACLLHHRLPSKDTYPAHSWHSRMSPTSPSHRGPLAHGYWKGSV